MWSTGTYPAMLFYGINRGFEFRAFPFPIEVLDNKDTHPSVLIDIILIILI